MTKRQTPRGGRSARRANKAGTRDWIDFCSKRLTVENPQAVFDLLGLGGRVEQCIEAPTEQRPRRSQKRRDLVLQLTWQGGAEQFVLLEFLSNPNPLDAIDKRMRDYIDDSCEQNHLPLLPILIFLDHAAAKGLVEPGRKLSLKIWQSGAVDVPGIGPIFAKQQVYVCVVLEDCLPDLANLRPDQSAWLPFYPMLWRKLAATELQRRLADFGVEVSEKVQPLEVEQRWDVIESVVDVLEHWQPNLAPMVISLIMQKYKLEEKDRFLYRHGREEGLAEGLAVGEAKGEARGEARGEAKALQAVVLKLGTKRWGKPSAAVKKKLASTTDLARLQSLADRILDADSWADLLAN